MPPPSLILFLPAPARFHTLRAPGAARPVPIRILLGLLDATRRPAIGFGPQNRQQCATSNSPTRAKPDPRPIRPESYLFII